MRVPPFSIPAAFGAVGAERLHARSHPVSGLVSTALLVSFALAVPPVRGAAPEPPQPVFPPDGQEGVPTEITLAARVDDPDGDSLDVRIEGRRAWTPGPDFTLALLPDTQYYTAETNGGTIQMFGAQTQWIMSHREEWNIPFVIHLGDIVENGDAPYAWREWQNANWAMSFLEDTQGGTLPEGMPYQAVCGNHEQWPRGDPNGTTFLYNLFFGANRFSGRSYYGGHFGSNNDNHYALFSASGIDFLVVSLEFDQDQNPEVLAWADALIGAHPDRLVILSVHYLIHPGNPGKYGPQGRALFDGLRHHPNLVLMVSGHVAGEGRRTETVDGRLLHLVLSNYQNRQNGGNGWMRLMRFEPAQERIRTFTYSPVLDEWEADADSSSQFTLPAPFLRREEAWQTLGLMRVAAGDTATCPWTDRVPLVPYEWRVTVTDGVDSVGSPVWRFRTGPRYPLTVTVEGGGSVTRDPQRPDYDPGTQVTLTAWPETGWRFAEWQGDAVGDDNPVTIRMDAPRSVAAVFADAEPPEVTVVWPNGGDTLRIGESVLLRWNATDSVGVSAVDLHLSRTGPNGPYETLAAGLDNSGTWVWTVSGPFTDDAYLRVSARDAAGGAGFDVSDAASLIVYVSGVSGPGETALGLVVSNPARSGGFACFTTPRAGPVTLRLFDVTGRCAGRLRTEPLVPGAYAVPWTALVSRHAPAGSYYLQLDTPAGRLTRPVVLIP